MSGLICAKNSTDLGNFVRWYSKRLQQEESTFRAAAYDVAQNLDGASAATAPTTYVKRHRRLGSVGASTRHAELISLALIRPMGRGRREQDG